MKDKANLLYMTGLSTDKKHFNNITENVHFDKDFKYWYKYIDKLTSSSLSQLKIFLDKNRNKIENEGVDILNLIIEFSGLEHATKLVKPVISFMLDDMTEDRKILQRNNKLLFDFIDKSTKRQKKYQIGDFFSFYLSNQSDSIGVMPLSILSQEKKFNFVNTYCDKDYFDNRYIDSVIIKVDPRFLKYDKNGKKFDIQQFTQDIFTTHLFDIYTSKLFTEFEFNEDNSTLSVFGFNEVQQSYWKDMKASFEERNFFGIGLLSYFFAGFEQIIEGMSKKISIHMACSDTDFNEYLKELIEYAIDPSLVEFVEEHESPILTMKLYISDGKELLNKDLHEDDFYKFTHGLSDKTLKKEFKHSTLEFNNETTIENIYYASNKWNSYIRLPIKMMLSLPRNKKGNPNQNLYIPYMVDNKNADTMDILTVGGAEHNRALAHLINKHRLHYKEDRIFGFLDNYYDLKHKLKFLKNQKYENAFLMALNQPVTGYNKIFAARRDSEEGESDAWEAKVIAFSLEDKGRDLNIVSVYGFSALASVYASHNIIALLSKEESFDGGIFNPTKQYYLQMYRDIREKYDTLEYKKKGLAALYRYKKGKSIKLLNKIFNDKHALHMFLNDRDKYVDAFTYNPEEDKIFDGQIVHGARSYE